MYDFVEKCGFYELGTSVQIISDHTLNSQASFSLRPHSASLKLSISFSGQPVLVEISLSLRNILEIDEHKQVSVSPLGTFCCLLAFVFCQVKRRYVEMLENFLLCSEWLRLQQCEKNFLMMRDTLLEQTWRFFCHCFRYRMYNKWLHNGLKVRRKPFHMKHHGLFLTLGPLWSHLFYIWKQSKWQKKRQVCSKTRIIKKILTFFSVILA